MMKCPTILLAITVAATASRGAVADVFHDYENFAEGFLGETVVHDGVTYRDANRVSGVFPDGIPFDENELGSEYIIERATVFYAEFPEYGSPDNSMTFGRAFIPGDNLTIGPLASVWMDLDEPGTSVHLDLGYLENGPWGGIEYVLEALREGAVVGTDSFLIMDEGGRDNGAVATLSIEGAPFDQLHLFARLDGQFTAPRGMIDDLRITSACVEDLDGSGRVDFADVLAVLAAWGECPGCPEDLTGDGAVTFADVLIILAAWGPCG